MKTPAFVENLVNAIGDISITEALNAIDREYAKRPDPAERIAALEASVIALRKALASYTIPERGWAELEHANAYEDSRLLVPDDEEERAEHQQESADGGT